MFGLPFDDLRASRTLGGRLSFPQLSRMFCAMVDEGVKATIDPKAGNGKF